MGADVAHAVFIPVHDPDLNLDQGSERRIRIRIRIRIKSRREN
jgi:hypothetical protein